MYTAFWREQMQEGLSIATRHVWAYYLQYDVQCVSN